MVNLGRPFVFPMAPARDASTSEKLQKIFDKVNYSSHPIVNVPIQLSFTEKLSAKIIATMWKEQIFRPRGDIFDYGLKQSNKKRTIP
jgi:hypothetical protein